MKKLLALALLLAAPLAAQVTTKKISDLPVASSANGGDLSVIVQGGVTKQCTVTQIRAGLFATTDALFFKTIDAPNGSDPVADSSTDTLIHTSTGGTITITGNSSTDTENFDVATGGIATAYLANNAVDDTKLRQGVARSVIGRSANSAGNPADIQCGGDGRFLGQHSSAIDCAAIVWGDVSGLAGTTSSTFANGDSTRNGPDGVEYSPDRHPSTCPYCEEWTGNAESQTWNVFNSDASFSKTINMDSAHLECTASGNQLRGYWLNSIPSGSSDYIVCAKLAVSQVGAFSSAGLVFLCGGTTASPTCIEEWLIQFRNTSADLYFVSTKYDNYSTFNVDHSTGNNYAYNSGASSWIYLRARYTSSTKNMVYEFSDNGRDFFTPTNLTFSSHPADIGIVLNCHNQSSATARFDWVRVIDSGAATSSPWPCGS